MHPSALQRRNPSLPRLAPHRNFLLYQNVQSRPGDLDEHLGLLDLLRLALVVAVSVLVVRINIEPHAMLSKIAVPKHKRRVRTHLGGRKRRDAKVEGRVEREGVESIWDRVDARDGSPLDLGLGNSSSSGGLLARSGHRGSLALLRSCSRWPVILVLLGFFVFLFLLIDGGSDRDGTGWRRCGVPRSTRLRRSGRLLWRNERQQSCFSVASI
jgi:hypothetical protein